MKVPLPSIDVDRLLVEFEVAGHPVPHDFTMEFIPNQDWKSDRHGKLGKHVPKPNPRLKTWQAKVGNACRRAMGGYARLFGKPVFVMFEFTVKPRNGEPDGSPMTTPVKCDGTKQDRTAADLDNLHKAAQDGLAGAVLANDVVVAGIFSRGVFGQNPGLKAWVYAM